MDELMRGRRLVDGVGAAVVVALLGGVVFIADRPVQGSRVRAAALVSELESARSSFLLEANRSSSLRANVSSLERALAESAVELPPSSSVNEQIAKLTHLADTVGVRIGSIRPGSSASSELFIERPVELTGTGGFDRLVVFLDELDERFPDLRVGSMRATKSDGGGGEVSFVLGLRWFSDRGVGL